MAGRTSARVAPCQEAGEAFDETLSKADASRQIDERPAAAPEGTVAGAANPHGMDEPVTQRRRHATVLDWTSDLDANEREELRMLRAAMGEHDGEIAALKAEAAELRRRLNDATAALRLLDRSRPWQRPAVWREIRCRGLLDATG